MKTISLTKINELLSAAKTLLKAKTATNKKEAAPAKAAESEAAR